MPIILNVIDNAKRGSIIDSAYGYKDAVDKYYFTKLMEENFDLNDTYSVSDGKLGGIDIPISGMKPTSGTLTYEDNDLTSGCLTFDDYKVTYDGRRFTSKLGTCPIERAITYTDSNGVKYYNTEWIGSNEVYYNPVTGVKCDDYHEDNSKTGYNGITTNGSADDNTANNNGCLKWYAYSEQNGNVNLLLDHNTTSKVAWVTKADYNKSYYDDNGAQSLGITYPNNSIVGEDLYGGIGNWNKGPITLLNQLKTDTNSWTAMPNRSDFYININNKYGENTTNYTINYSGYKARLITAGEIANIVNNISWSEKTSKSSFTMDSDFSWLLRNLSNSNTNDAPYGYWTVSSNAYYSDDTWQVDYDGRVFYYGSVSLTSRYGLRPVITIPKYSIFES